MKKRGMIVTLLAAALSFLFFGVAFSYEAVDVQGGGTITGRVTLAGNPPPPKIVQVGQDREVCGKTQEIYEVEVKNGRVKNAVVKIVGITKGKKLDFPEAVLDQQGCVFIPHIALVPPGNLTVVNSDPVSHNIHTYTAENESVNITLTKLMRKTSLSLQVPETIPVKCDQHGFMRAYIVVLEHPYYAVTGDGGSFELRDVPPGTYTLEVWHEKLGKRQQKVTVKSGKVETVELTYK